MLNTEVGVPITPKLHILAVHVEEWISSHQRSLELDSEQALEASHSIFLKLWNSYCVKDEDSSAYEKNGLAVGLKFNADNTISNEY